MNGLRVVFVTRRSWPLLGGAENAIAVLATEMRARGAKPTIVTARWGQTWPSRVFYGEVPIVRLPRPRGQAWGEFRYLHALRRWLKQHRHEVDLACVSKMRLEAYTTLSALRGTSIPVVLRAEQAGVAGCCQWHQHARFGRRIRQECRAATAVIATDASVGEELARADFDEQQVHLIPNGTAIQPARSPAVREAARRALGEVNSDLKTHPETKIVLFLGRLRKSNGLMPLVDAWPNVLAECREARLWLVGDGPLRDALADKIRDLQLQSTVLMPGSFDEVADVLSAADLLVCPTPEPGMPLALLEATAACLPIVAIDTPTTRACSPTSGENAQLVPPDDVTALGRALIRYLQYPPPRHAVLAACRSVHRAYDFRRMIDEHADLFQRLVSQQCNEFH